MDICMYHGKYFIYKINGQSAYLYKNLYDYSTRTICSAPSKYSIDIIRKGNTEKEAQSYLSETVNKKIVKTNIMYNHINFEYDEYSS